MGEVLVVDTVESPQTVGMTSKIGNRRYPHSTALGKILLANLPERDMLRLVRSKGMPKFTPATIINEVLGDVAVPVPGAKSRAEEEEVVWQ